MGQSIKSHSLNYNYWINRFAVRHGSFEDFNGHLPMVHRVYHYDICHIVIQIAPELECHVIYALPVKDPQNKLINR